MRADRKERDRGKEEAENMRKAWKCMAEKCLRLGMRKEEGIDGILVTIGLCIIALVLCVVMKDSLSAFIHTIVGTMTEKANAILQGV